MYVFLDNFLGVANVVPWHTGICGTLSLTETTVSTNSSCSGEFTSACAGVHGNWLADDEAIGNEFADGLTGVGVGDFAGLVGVEPNLALSAADDGSRQTFLSCKVDPIVRKKSQLLMLSVFSKTCCWYRSKKARNVSNQTEMID